MKMQLFHGLVALIAFCGTVSSVQEILRSEDALECTWGPSYWCQNLTTAAGCRAVKHCIQTVWIYKQLPPDNTNVCQTCLEMVKEARDQLLSNDTQELIKEVFEGSCALLHFKVVVKECDKIADDFIPELIDTLASEMNPQTVCAVAGLCNNERYLQLLAEERKSNKGVDKCDGCQSVVGVLERKFNKMTRDQILQSFLEACGNTGSLSDGCSNIIITYFNEIYSHLKNHLNSEEVCLMSGECSSKFHTHANVEIIPKSHIGYVQIDSQENDDLPCELCEQLVSHLRDLLVANTTEDEFKLVLEGFCKQSKSFKDECLSLVDQYYAEAYNFLVQQLDATAVCTLTGLCPRNNTLQVSPVIPLLPVQTVPKAVEMSEKEKLVLVDMSKNSDNVKILETAEEAQLPIERLMPPHSELYNSETCVFCEYLLHYLQEYITKPTTEDEIKRIVDDVCSKLPPSVNNTCTEFVNMYEPALVAILAQEIDPSTVCPLIKACPSNNRDIEVFIKQASDEKCPLCLFAVEKLEQMVKDKKTEANIKAALEKLCIHLPKSVAAECNDFVDAYTDELVEMLIADLNATEICVYLKLCTDQDISTKKDISGGDISTNDIIDNTINGETLKSKVGGSQCVVCEFVMKEIQDQLKDNNTEAYIMQTVHRICNVMPKTISSECNDFVNEYGDTVIQLLIQMTDPSEICRSIGLCDNQIPQAKVEIFDCAICESLVYAMEKILANPKIDHDVNHVLEKACRALPRESQKKCLEIVDKYGTTIYNLIIHLADKGLICKEVGLCANKVYRMTRRDAELVGKNPCTWGPSYWCLSEQNANTCSALEHCKGVWKKNKPQLIGSNKCTWGPSYWCDSNENAQECKALEHCQEKVWKAQSKP